MVASCAFRVGFWLWAECPPVTVARAEGVPLSLYEVAALRADDRDPDHLATTLLDVMLVTGALRFVDRGRLRAVTGAVGRDRLQTAVLANVRSKERLWPWDLRDRAARLDELRTVQRDLRAAGLVTRSRSEFSYAVHLCVMVVIGAVGVLVFISTRSLLGTLVLAGLLVLGGVVVRLAPERRGNASRRGRRLLKGLHAQGPRPALVPGLVLDDRQHTALTRMALHHISASGLSSFGSGSGASATDSGHTINEGPGLGGL